MVDTRDQPLSILYVDDEPGLLEIGKIFLEKDGKFTVTTAGGPDEGIKLLKEQPFDAIISDYQMPGMDGIAFLKHLRLAGDTTPFIIFTGKGREEVVIEALNEGADFYLQKEGDPKAQFAELANKIRYAAGKKRSEEALATSEKQFNLLFEHMNAGFALHEILLDTSGKPIDYRYLAINPAFEKLTGLSAGALLGRTVREVLPGTEEYWISTFGEIALTGASRQFENYSAVLGKWYDVLAYSPAYGQFAVSIQDVTERKTAEEKLRRSHDELHAANEQLAASEEEMRSQLEEIISIRDLLDESNEYLENLITYANAPIIVWDRDLRITKFNNAFGRLTGIPPEQAIGSHIEVLFPSERRDVAMDMIQRAMAGETWDVVEIPIQHRSGEVRSVLWNSANIRGSDGKTIIATIAQGQDITDRKKAELALLEKNEELHQKNEELAATEEELRHNIEELEAQELAIRKKTKELADIIEFLPDATFVIDADKTVIAWNRAIEELTGVCKEEILNRGDYAYSVPFYLEKRSILVDLVLGDKGDTSSRYPFIRKEGDRLISEVFIPHLNGGRGADLWFTASPLYDDDGRIIGAIESIRDITEKKAAEEALLEKNEELAASEEEIRSQLDEIITIRDQLDESNEYLGNLITYANAPIIVWDKRCRITRFNNAFGTLTGIVPDEAIGKDLTILFPEESRDASIDLIRRAMDGETWDVVEIPNPAPIRRGEDCPLELGKYPGE